MNKKGFTLIELLVTISILALIMIIAIPSIQGISGNIKEKLLKTKISEAKEAFLLWAQDNKNCIFNVGNTSCMIDKNNCPQSGNVITCSTTMGVLAANSLIEADIENTNVTPTKYTILNPVDNTDMSETVIQITYNTNTKMFDVLDAQIITNTTSTTTTTTSTTTTTTTASSVACEDFILTKDNAYMMGYDGGNTLDLKSPFTYDNKCYNIVEISNSAFYENTNITGHITIPSTVKKIGYHAFYKTGITGVTLNEGLETIDFHAFDSISSLTGNIVLPSTLKDLGSAVFQASKISSVTFNDKITEIKEATFNNGLNNKGSMLNGHLTIPANIKNIGNNAFAYTGITGLTLNEGLENIGSLAFYDNNNLNGSLTIPSTVKSIGNSAFYKTAITDLTLNEGLETIGNNVFASNSNLEGTITIPRGVQSIGENAFLETAITGLNLNEGLKTIGQGAFDSLTNLTLNTTFPSTLESIGMYTFRNTSLSGHLTIPNSVTSIDMYAFSGTKITGLTLSENLENISSSAFADIPTLSGTLIIPSSVKTIENWAFGSYGTRSGINNIVLNEGLETIGPYAFYNTSITQITIPKSVKSIGYYAFVLTSCSRICYRGTQAEWNQMNVDSEAFPNMNNIVYNCTE